MDWAGGLPAGEEEEMLPNGNEPAPVPPSLDEHIPSVEVGAHSKPVTAFIVAARAVLSSLLGLVYLYEGDHLVNTEGCICFRISNL